MKIVAILGSPHGTKGATGAVLAELIRSAGSAGAEVDLFDLKDHPIGPCAACDVCHKTGRCPRKDDFEKIKSAMLAADGVVLASPNYITSVTAQMKALFDRCCGPLHCQSMIGKYAAAVETSGGPEGGQVQQYMLHFLRSLGCWTVGSAGATAAALANPASRAAALAPAAKLGEMLVDAIRQKRTYPEQAGERKAFFERMKAVVMHRKDDWPYEREHWKKQGWV